MGTARDTDRSDGATRSRRRHPGYCPSCGECDVATQVEHYRIDAIAVGHVSDHNRNGSSTMIVCRRYSLANLAALTRLRKRDGSTGFQPLFPHDSSTEATE